jgi:hypothetical protein
VRDQLLRARKIVNVAKVNGSLQALDHVLERKEAHLYHVGDPTIRHLLPAPGADGEQIAPASGADPELHLLPAPRPIREQGVGPAAAPADFEVEDPSEFEGEQPSLSAEQMAVIEAYVAKRGDKRGRV